MKKILLLMTNMECGGVQVSLLNFINELKKYDVDITVLFDYAEGCWMNRIPPDVHIEQVKYTSEGIHKLIWPHRKVSALQNFVYHVLVHIVDWGYKSDGRNNRYTFLLSHIKPIENKYDLAIDYHGYGAITTVILANKVEANRKVVFIHDENMECMHAAEIDLRGIDKFYSVSKSCQRIFNEIFPEYADKSSFCPNLIDRESIIKKANEDIEIQWDNNCYNIVTVGRVMGQKGYDFAVKVAARLKAQGVFFKWYCIGDGLCMDEIKKLILQKDLVDEFIMLGQKDNPYPYIKAANLYVQTSRHEGFGLAIAEALVLGKVVVSTNLECVAEQIINNKTGFLLDFSVEEFAECIEKLMNDVTLNERILQNVKRAEMTKIILGTNIIKEEILANAGES